MVGVEHGLAPLGRRPACGQKRTQHAHRGERDLERAHARKLQRFGQKPHDLGIGRGGGVADQLHAHLRGFTRLGLRLALHLAEHALHVTEAERSGLAGQARGAHAGDLQRDVGAHGQKVAAGVEELERHARQAAAGSHDVHHLERGRLDGQVALARHVRQHRAGGLLAQHRLVGQHVAEPRRRHVIHASHPAFRVKFVSVVATLAQ